MNLGGLVYFGEEFEIRNLIYRLEKNQQTVDMLTAQKEKEDEMDLRRRQNIATKRPKVRTGGRRKKKTRRKNYKKRRRTMRLNYIKGDYRKSRKRNRKKRTKRRR